MRRKIEFWKRLHYKKRTNYGKPMKIQRTKLRAKEIKLYKMMTQRNNFLAPCLLPMIKISISWPCSKYLSRKKFQIFPDVITLGTMCAGNSFVDC